jgi:hypothetical protein
MLEIKRETCARKRLHLYGMRSDAERLEDPDGCQQGNHRGDGYDLIDQIFFAAWPD